MERNESHTLTRTLSVGQPPRDFLASVGTIFRIFGPDTQDSGNVSYGIETAGRRFFVKATDPEAEALFDYDDRVELLRNALRVARSCRHPALPLHRAR